MQARNVPLSLRRTSIERLIFTIFAVDAALPNDLQGSRFLNGLSSTNHTKLLVQMYQMGFHGTCRYKQTSGDLIITAAFCKQFEQLDFTIRQPECRYRLPVGLKFCRDLWSAQSGPDPDDHAGKHDG
jgi:hypothetical protein